MADIFKIKTSAEIPYSSAIALQPATGILVYNNAQSYEPTPINISGIENKYTGAWLDQPNASATHS